MSLKVLALHGIGHQDAKIDQWQDDWRTTVKQRFQLFAAGLDVGVEFLGYDDLFDPYVAALTYTDFVTAFGRLLAGALRRPRGLFDLSDDTRWYPGMVVAWVNNEQLRADLRDRFLATLDEAKPDLVLAHSLGTLIAYDALGRDDAKLQGKALLTCGSQIGNTFVRGVFAGRVGPLPSVARWFHLYNENDHVFTAPLDFGDFLTAANFTEVETTFGNYVSSFAANHDALAYLTHPATLDAVWPSLAALGTAPAPARALALPAAPKVAAPAPVAITRAERRALLIGINNYPKAEQRLEGCVNDVFLLSSVLQECGFQAEDIRVVLDERATAQGLRDRLRWLLEGTRKGDVRFLFYSGHGAQLPTYGPEGKIDRIDSCLVPFDFDWSRATAVTDDDLVNLYSQLPYDAHFMMVLDCCYAGGLTRGGTRSRGLDPPDDIRHRLLRWNKDLGMWELRELPPANPDLTDLYTGPSGADRRLGRAMSLRTLPNKEYDATRAAFGHKGPYLPVVYEACGPQEFSFEYQHGVVSYGAFSFAVAEVLRQRRARGEAITFADLLTQTGEVLQRFGYDQHPIAIGPAAVLNEAVP
jgi:hypothetical protein